MRHAHVAHPSSTLGFKMGCWRVEPRQHNTPVKPGVMSDDLRLTYLSHTVTNK